MSDFNKYGFTPISQNKASRNKKLTASEAGHEMREIKFRAWWIQATIMLHHVEDFYDTLGDKGHGNEYEPEASFGGILRNPDEYIVMQYTGLKDKNGVEIYEGDLVRDPYGEIWEIFYSMPAPNTPYYWGCINKSKSKSLHELAFMTSEIIGNIYENPELCTG